MLRSESYMKLYEGMTRMNADDPSYFGHTAFCHTMATAMFRRKVADFIFRVLESLVSITFNSSEADAAGLRFMLP